MTKQYTNIPVDIKSAGDDTLWTTMSTNDIDRHGESVVQNWNLDNFMNNPVVLNSHQYNDTTEAIGRVEALVQKEDSLEGKVKFAINENPKAKVIFDLYKGGFLNAFSVGFIPGEEENELLELSAVTIPANALALAKAKGLDIDEEVDYSELTVNQLKEVLKEKELPTTGNKKELVGRLEDNEEVEEEDELEQTEKEIKALYEEKAGRVLSASNRKKVETAINALEALLSADKGYYEDNIPEDPEEPEIKQLEDDEEEVEVEFEADEGFVEELNPTKNINSVLKALHKELNETHEDNLSIKKKKIHKALRNLQA